MAAKRPVTVGSDFAEHGRIRWVSTTLSIVAVDEGGTDTAVLAVSAQIYAIDDGSSAAYPDQWYGTLRCR
jgi:hypothetical protein